MYQNACAPRGQFKTPGMKVLLVLFSVGFMLFWAYALMS